MSSQISGDQNSDLWIALDDAVACSGVSKRTIQEWVRSGEVKREKRKGKVYLWVADLTAMTPLTRPEPEVETSTPEPEALLPEVVDSYVAGASMKAVGERLRENRQLQEKILARLEDVGGAIDAVKEQGLSQKGSGLDERTVKELSLLGNVFRSIHQQNDKVSKALESQEGLLKKLEDGLDREVSWTEKWMLGQQKLARWKVVCMALLCVMCAGVFVFWQELDRAWMSLQEEMSSSELERRELQEEISAKSQDLLLLEKKREEELKKLEQEKEALLLSEKSAHREALLNLKQQYAKELREKERLLEALEGMSKKQLSMLEERHREELQRSQLSQEALLKELTEKMGAVRATIAERSEEQKRWLEQQLAKQELSSEELGAMGVDDVERRLDRVAREVKGDVDSAGNQKK